ncbi:MAG: adenylosuccinate lyase [Candidatus Aenigmarchaeota archaeon]|nr:adenylosuccinate lyase [Candidatus Aenigmarchaeota archaeon]
MAIHPIEYRYYSDEMKKVFDEEAKLDSWLKVEASLAKAHAKLGNIPKKAADEISKKANTNDVKVKRVKEIEEQIHHDLMAMVKALTEVTGDSGKYVHYGSTSYDIEDTALSLQLRDASEIVEKDLKAFKKVLITLTKKYKKVVCIGRTHGQHAVPTTYGLKFANWLCEIERGLERLSQVKERIVVGKMTGAVGTQATFGKNAEKLQKIVMKDLGLKPVMVSTQVIQRDRHAELIFVIALIGSTLDKIAKEIRNLQRTEIAEVMEKFGKKQVGSSTMPHKRNPWKSENVCSLARILKSHVSVALDNNPLEHERDLTNSASERIIFPESFMILDFMLRRITSILESIELHPENIEKNLNLTNGLVMSEHFMIGLVKKGIGRQDAHEILRISAMESYKKNISLKSVLLKNPTVAKNFTEKEIDHYLDPKNYIGTAIQQVDNVLKLVGDK